MAWLDDDQRQQFESQIDVVEKELCTPIAKEKRRFSSYDRLLGRFRDVKDRLRSQGLDALNSFFEIQNELCVAVAILEDKTDGGCTRIEYERPLGTCGELFDFEVEYRVGPTRWAEVKTIHPKRQDDWKKFARDSAMNRFPDGSQIILERDWMGGELYHSAIAARSKIMDYTLETEEKIADCLDPSKPRITFLVLFSNGFDWHADELEDFLFFYRTGVHFPGDPFSKMEEHYVATKNIGFKRNIQHFGFIERPDLSIRPNSGTWSVPLPSWPPKGGMAGA